MLSEEDKEDEEEWEDEHGEEEQRWEEEEEGRGGRAERGIGERIEEEEIEEDEEKEKGRGGLLEYEWQKSKRGPPQRAAVFERKARGRLMGK